MIGKECNNNGNEGCGKEGGRKGKSVDVKRNVITKEEKWKNDNEVCDKSCKVIKCNNGDILEQTSDILKRFTSRSQHRERTNREVIVKQSTPLYPKRSKIVLTKHNKDNNNNNNNNLKVNVYKHPNINTNNQKVHNNNNNNNNNYIVRQYNCKEKTINNTVNHNHPNEVNNTNQIKCNVVTDNYKLNSNNNNNIVSNVTTTTTSFNKVNQNINPCTIPNNNPKTKTNTNTNRTNKLNTTTSKIKPKEINYQAKYEKLKHELDKLKSELIKERQKGNDIKKELSKYEKKEKQYDDITQTNTEITKSNETIYNKILLSETIRTEQQNLINSLQLEYNRIKQCMYNQYGEIPSSLTKPYTTLKPPQTPLSKQHNTIK